MPKKTKKNSKVVAFIKSWVKKMQNPKVWIPTILIICGITFGVIKSLNIPGEVSAVKKNIEKLKEKTEEKVKKVDDKVKDVANSVKNFVEQSALLRKVDSDRGNERMQVQMQQQTIMKAYIDAKIDAKLELKPEKTEKRKHGNRTR